MLELGDLIKSVVDIYRVYPHTDICHTGPNDECEKVKKAPGFAEC